MGLVEGLGDEVTYAMLFLLVILVLSLAWISTGIRPFNYYVWLIQLQTWPQRRVIQVLHMDERSANQLERETSTDSQLTTRTWRVPSDDHETTTDETSIITQLSHMNELQVEIEELNPSAHGATAQMAVADSVPLEVVTRQSENVTDSGLPGSKSEPESAPQPPHESISPTEGTASNEPGDTRIKLKFLDDTQKMVAAWLSQTVGDFKREHFTPAVHEGKVVRLIYRGQLLRDDGRSLASYGLHDNCIVHCHVSTTPYESDNNTGDRGNRSQNFVIGNEGNENGGRLHVGRYINIIFSLKFLALWLGAVLYPEFFDFASFFSLFMCTVVYGLFLFTNYRTREPGPDVQPLSPPAVSATVN